jgi:hypothetical protein
MYNEIIAAGGLALNRQITAKASLGMTATLLVKSTQHLYNHNHLVKLICLPAMIDLQHH